MEHALDAAGPGTRVVLIATPLRELLGEKSSLPETMSSAYNAAFTTMTNHINTPGDGPLLPPDFDPYATPRVAGWCPYHLTLQVTVNALRWLWEFLDDVGKAGGVIMPGVDERVQPDGEKIGVVCLGEFCRTVYYVGGIAHS
ncbi:MAG: hypothetical protein Q9175_003302 [Cornicularia normoerica]